LLSDVAGERLPVPDAQAPRLKLEQGRRRAGRLVRVDVEHPDDRAPLVGGKSIAGNERLVLRHPDSQLTRRVPRGGDQPRLNLPVQRITGLQHPVKRDRRRRRDPRHGLLIQLPLPIAQVRLRQLLAPSEHRRLRRRPDHLGARASGNRARGAEVIGVGVSQQDLANRDRPLGDTEALGQRREDRLILPGVTETTD